MAKVVCLLYDDPIEGYPASSARDDLPRFDRCPDGQILPTPRAVDFRSGALLGSVSGELELRKYLESNGHHLVVTADKDGIESVFEGELVDADIVISQPFWPAYLTAARIAKAPKLKLAITAGIGSDQVDLQAAMARGMTVAEVTCCSAISVAEDAVTLILALVRNYLPSYLGSIGGAWNIAGCIARPSDLEGMHVGAVGAGRIGLSVLLRLKPFDVHLHYCDRYRLPLSIERELGLTWHPTVGDLVSVCDVVSIHAPLHPQTENLFDDDLIATMKRGAYLVNTAHGRICNRDAIARGLETGKLAGYAGDVWLAQPALRDHPSRSMPCGGAPPSVSATSLSAQVRYAAGAREILECWFAGRPIREEYLIVDRGKLVGAGAHACSPGKATAGRKDALRFKKSA